MVDLACIHCAQMIPEYSIYCPKCAKKLNPITDFNAEMSVAQSKAPREAENKFQMVLLGSVGFIEKFYRFLFHLGMALMENDDNQYKPGAKSRRFVIAVLIGGTLALIVFLGWKTLALVGVI